MQVSACLVNGTCRIRVGSAVCPYHCIESSVIFIITFILLSFFTVYYIIYIYIYVYILYLTDETVIQNQNSGTHDDASNHGDVSNHGDTQADPKPTGGKGVIGGIRKVRLSKKEAKKLKTVPTAEESPTLTEKGVTAESQMLDHSWQ